MAMGQDTFITLLAIAACLSPPCQSCLLGRCCESACSCPYQWKGSCGWSNAGAQQGWPGWCMGEGGTKRSMSVLWGGHWQAERNDEGKTKFIVSTIGVFDLAAGLLFCQKSPHPINLDDLELLSDISWVGRQPGPARDKTKEQHSLFIGELLQALPKPANKLVALCDVTVTHQLL